MERTLDLGTPSAKQRLFLQAKEKYVAYGGARGGGKSWVVRQKALYMALRYPGIRLLIVRRTLPELEENHIRQIRELLRPFLKPFAKDGWVRWAEQKKQFTFDNGSVMSFGYCEAERDVLRYQGQEYDCIFLDEATQLTEFQFQTFKGCLRGVNDFPKHLYVTCNPGGVGHEWVKRLFIDRDYRAGEQAEEHCFIQASVYDNRALMEADPDYVKNLESLPYELREAWLHGKWELAAGRFFREWSREIHVVEPFAVPAHWRRYVALDYGMDMLAALLIAVDEESNAWVLREVYDGYELGEGRAGLTISEAAERLLALTEGTEIYQWLAPPDLWGRRQESGRSVADLFAERGIWLTRTSSDRVAGWAAVRELLRIRRDEFGRDRAALRVFPFCVNLIRTLPLLQYDERKFNDCRTEPHEITHAPDALRYFAVSWIEAAAAPKEEKKGLSPLAKQAQKLRGRR